MSARDMRINFQDHRKAAQVAELHVNQDWTMAALLAFLELAGDVGLMNSTTAKAYRAATGQVIDAVYLAPESIMDIRQIDVETVLGDFERHRGDAYTPASLSTYKTRFKRSLELYTQFLSDPDSLNGDEEEDAGPTVVYRRDKSGRVVEVLHYGVERDVPPGQEIVEYPFPLAGGGMAYLRLPRELHPADVERLSRFLSSLTIEPSQQVPLCPEHRPPE